MASSTLIDILNPTIDVKKHADSSCECIWIDVRNSDNTVVQLAFSKKEDLHAFVGMLILTTGYEKRRSLPTKERLVH